MVHSLLHVESELFLPLIEKSSPVKWFLNRVLLYHRSGMFIMASARKIQKEIIMSISISTSISFSPSWYCCFALNIDVKVVSLYFLLCNDYSFTDYTKNMWS